MRSQLRLLAFALALGSVTTTASAQVARMEVLPFQSTTLTDPEFLSGRKDGKPVTIAGQLRLPRPGNDRLPTVVLLHGSGGISGFVAEWEQELNSAGFATFVVDSWAGRGVTSTVLDQSLMGRMVQLFDAYRALEVLEKHPRVDPARVAVMGFSRGGQGALYSAVKRFQRAHGPASGREFAAYIALYPTCNTAYRNDEEVTSNPIRILHGAADDYVPIGPCRDYAKRLKAKGVNIEHTEYPDAHHVFDWPALKKPVAMAKAQTTRNCRLEELDAGMVVNAKTRQPFTYADSCVEYGVTIAYNEKAHTDARKTVREFLAATLKPPL
jgi:dienelactone hydrolase